MSNIKSKVISGLVWTYSERICAQLVSLIVSIVLARLLSPKDYGIISLGLVFITLANVLVSDGFGSALIQKKDADNIDFSSMLYFSVACSVCIYFILFAIAPLIAAFYNEPQLSSVTRVFSIKIILASINSIQQAYISKKMDFKKFFFATLIGTITSGFVGVILAYRGFGVWALVAQYLTNSFMDTFFLSITIGWKPMIVFSWKRIKEMFGYATRLLVVSLLTSLYSNIRDLIIGKEYSVEDLSYTNKGEQFPSLISVNINSSITKVLFPVVSKYQDDINAVKNFTRKAISIGTFLLSPILIGLAAVAPAFISVILSDKWLPCIPYLRIMCIVYLLQPIQTASLQAMKALGKSKLYLNLEIIKWVFGIGTLCVAIFFFNSVYVVVFSALIAETFATLINWRPNKKILNYSYREQLHDVVKPAISCIVMYAIVSSLNNVNCAKILLLVLQIMVGIITYLISNVVLRNESLPYIMRTIKYRRTNK